MSTITDQFSCLQQKHDRVRSRRRLQAMIRVATQSVSIAVALLTVLVFPTLAHGQNDDTTDDGTGVVSGETASLGIGYGAGLYFDYWPSRNTRYSLRAVRGILGVGGLEDEEFDPNRFSAIGGVSLRVIHFDWAGRPVELERGSLDREKLLSLQERGAIEIVDEWDIITSRSGSFVVFQQKDIKPGMYLVLPDWKSRSLGAERLLTVQVTIPIVSHSIDDGDELNIIFQNGF